METKENCRICGFLRKAEIARQECEKRAQFLVRQRTEPIDFDYNLVSVGSEITFLTLYGYQSALVTGITKDETKGFVLHFNPIQIGPEKAFTPVDHWCLNFNQQSCRKTA